MTFFELYVSGFWPWLGLTIFVGLIVQGIVALAAALAAVLRK